VNDLSVASADDGSIVVRFTEVNNGAGQPANYAIRRGSPNVTWWEAVSTERTVSGGAIGQTLEYRYSGLSAGTDYQFQLVAYRGTLNQDAAFGNLSNKAAARTTAAASSGPAVVASVLVGSSSHQFSAIGETQSFPVTARDPGGATISGVAFTWHSLNSGIASVNANGLVTARAIGSTAIVVAAACCSQAADTVAVLVSQVPRTIQVAPSSFSVMAGETRPLTAAVLDANNFPVPGVLVQWSTSNPSVATVTGSGLVSGIAPGTATLNARFAGLTGQASAQVQAAAPTGGGSGGGSTGGSSGGGGTGSGGQGGANEPAGFTMWRDHDMESVANRPGGGPQTYPVEGGNTFARYAYAAGTVPENTTRGPTGGGYFNYGFGPGVCVSAFYLSYDFRYSANFKPHTAGNKQVYHRSEGGGEFYTNWRGGQFELSQQGFEASRNYPANAGNVNAGVGEWHTLEILVRNNGAVQMWVDGTLTHNYGPGGIFSGTACWNRLNFDSLWGGGGGTIPSEQYLDYDNIYVSRQ
jgi:hypothetical protein